MKRLKLFILVAIFIIASTSLCAVAVAASNTASGINFVEENYYQSAPKSLMLPSTFEATVCISPDQTGRAGVIFGSYSEDKIPLFNFEIHENGAPRLYINDNDENVTNYDVIFKNVNVCTGKPVHVAITVDYAAGIWSCYVDGVLRQTITKPAPSPYVLTAEFRLGGDLRKGNAQYFKGNISKIALYRDIRTAAEIASDCTADTFDSDKIICAYDLTQNKPGDAPSNIRCKAGSGIDFKLYATWLTDITPPEDFEYSMALIGDIQSLNYYYPEMLPILYDWLRDNADELKIKFAVGLGDITDKNQIEEYARVNQVYAKIKGVIPFSIIRGNHDRSGLSSERYDKYITQAKYGDEITGAFDGTMLNTYRIIQVEQVKYLFMNLDFLLKDEVLDWANEIIAQNKDCRVIVSTHIYMNYTGKYYTLTGDSGIGTKYGCENNGDDLWNKVLSRHENVIMMICGHNPTDDIYYRQKTGVHGNKVTEILVDPQTTDREHNGTGLVAMLYFTNGGKDVEVQYYSTIKDAYFKTNNQFKIKLDIPESTIPETTPAETTPVVTPPEETTPAETEPAVTDILVDDGGCGTVMTSTALLFALAAGGVLIKKKKR